LTSVYSEHLLMGYRWYDANDVTPAYPFGHGSSYTTFAYSDLKLEGRKLTVSIENTGEVFGKEIA
jgi:beta-glucosidase